MATTEISLSSFQTACAECADAIEAGTWGIAATKYAKAEAIGSGLEVQLGHDSASIRRRETLSGLQVALKFAQSQSTKISDNRRLVSTRMGY